MKSQSQRPGRTGKFTTGFSGATSLSSLPDRISKSNDAAVRRGMGSGGRSGAKDRISITQNGPATRSPRKGR